MSHSAKLHALCASARIANIPSVAGNVWLGIALAATLRDALPDGHFWVLAAALGLAGVCLYLAGSFLNDWADRDWDAAHRPERALPQALMAPGFYLSVALACGTLGMCLAAAVHRHSLLVALLIVSCIVLYTWVHKRSAWSVVPLGLCRALLPVLGFVGCVTAELAPFSAWSAGTARLTAALAACACGMFLHIAGLSLNARYETMEEPPAGVIGLSRILFPASATAMFLASWLLLSFPLLFCVLGLLPYGLWMGFCLASSRQSVEVHVANLLGAIPLVDLIVLWPLALIGGANRWAPPLPTVCILIPILAFSSGRLLQRLSPAT
ncbi:MAG: UbiA family prenyltransferase [Verrucomicrobia bacterium]|nr:UbiA family prenyltransferase [Verrucomicrobiota bacterium]